MDESNTNSISVEGDPSVALDRLAREMVVALDRIIYHMVAAVPIEESCAEIPLTLQEVRVIKTISPKGAITMSTLASSLGVSLPTATHLVDRLVAKGIVVRTKSEHDRRLVLVTLSDLSKANDRKFFENRVALILGFLEPLGPAERGQVVNVLAGIAEAVQSRAAGLTRQTDPQ
jgi:DNA-binding MarR family transcriptional regulator